MKKDIYHIASDYFNSCISESDLKSLQIWLSKSPDNKKLLDELGKVWKLTGNLSFDIDPDVEAEWKNFVRERDKVHYIEKFKSGRQINWIRILRVAAVVIPSALILSLGFFYLRNKNNGSEWIIISTVKEKKECLLSDGTKVWINKNSTFSYPSRFLKNERIVKLDGEAFFEVAKRKVPFKVNTLKTEIVVLGTAFNVRAYKQERFTEVIVRNGKVAFEEKVLHKQKTLLTGGEKGIYHEGSEKISKQTVTDLNLVGWKEDRLIFRDTPLSEIQTVIQRYFDIHAQLSPSMETCKFTGEFTKPGLDDMLNVISISLGASYKIKNDTVFITGQGCREWVMH